MGTVNLELPADLVVAAKLDQGNVSEEAAKLIALELFREGTVSIGRAAELCATPLPMFMDFAAAHGVPPARLRAGTAGGRPAQLIKIALVTVISDPSPLITLSRIGR